MTVYVDELREYNHAAVTRRYGNRWCHMACDGDVTELHMLAERIGMRRAWFQPKPNGLSHYDLTPQRRLAAVRAGAVEVSPVELIRRCKRREVQT